MLITLLAVIPENEYFMRNVKITFPMSSLRKEGYHLKRQLQGVVWML